MAVIPDKELKCQRIAKMIASGKGVCESCREMGISEKTYYRWKKKKAERGESHA